MRLANSRELDMSASPGRPGLQARVKLGAKRDGTLVAADIRFLFDSGAFADYAVNVSRAAGYACTGPYRVPNVKADSLCVYTNHPFATAYRGFGHIEMSFAVERAMDLLAEELGMDPVELRLINAVVPGDSTPSRQIPRIARTRRPSAAKRLGREWGRRITTTSRSAPRSRPRFGSARGRSDRRGSPASGTAAW